MSRNNWKETWDATRSDREREQAEEKAARQQEADAAEQRAKQAGEYVDKYLRPIARDFEQFLNENVFRGWSLAASRVGAGVAIGCRSTTDEANSRFGSSSISIFVADRHLTVSTVVADVERPTKSIATQYDTDPTAFVNEQCALFLKQLKTVRPGI